MYFKQFTTPGLGCFSYLIGCPAAGTAAVVDPRRDIDEYLDAAAGSNLRITHIFETHVHADHISGAQELAAATGAGIYIHESAQITYPAKRIKQGDIFEFGAAKVTVLHTPGHTPNSTSLLLADKIRSPEPEMILTGDLLFVGDVGRPDLPGHEIMDEQIRNLYHSLYNVLGGLPDGLEIWPAHGQGSLCGSGMSARGQSTLGYERLTNPMLRHNSFEDFRKAILGRLPMRPQSFSSIISANSGTVPLLRGRAAEDASTALSPAQVSSLLKKGAIILDVRDAMAFAGAHIPGSLNVDATEGQAVNWIGTVVKPGSALVLLLSVPEDFNRLLTDLHRIGYDNVKGYLKGGLKAWLWAGKPVASLPVLAAEDFRDAVEEKRFTLLDVRTPGEWADGRIKGSLHVPIDALVADPKAWSAKGPFGVTCQSGFRANMAAALLQAESGAGVSVLAGGVMAWKSAGLPLEK